MADGRTSQQGLTQEINATRANEEKLQVLIQTLPIGISILGEDRKPINTNPALDTLFNRADQALYTEKENGRDQVSLWRETK